MVRFTRESLSDVRDALSRNGGSTLPASYVTHTRCDACGKLTSGRVLGGCEVCGNTTSPVCVIELDTLDNAGAIDDEAVADFLVATVDEPHRLVLHCDGEA